MRLSAPVGVAIGTAMIGGLPVALMAGLDAAGLLPAPVAVAAAGIMVAGAACLNFIWMGDIARLERGAPPLLWPFRRVGRALAERERAAHDLATQARSETQSDRAILDALPDPLLVLSADRALRYANDAARLVLGSELPAVLRHPTLRGAIDRVSAAAGRALKGASESVDLLIPVPVQRDLHATVIDLGPGLAGGRFALLFADRTRARAVERMRADFVANASHELRTPLASLIGFIETLRGPAADDTEAQTRFLAIMAEQAERMNRLIDDLLSLSRIELSEHMAPSTRIDLADVVARTLSSFEPRRLQAGATLREDVTDGLPRVPADEDQIEQVLQNLLDNALKYGASEGTIVVSLREASGGRWPARPGVVLSVKDDGPGISRVHLPRLTERFYRVDRGRSRAAGGTGLGLAIVKHIVNRHRGQLAIDSEESAGSTFSVWLPLAG